MIPFALWMGADGAVGALGQLHLAEGAAQAVDHQQAAAVAFAHAGQDLDGFERLQAAHQSHHGGEYTGFDSGEGLLAKQGAEAGVAGFIFLPGKAAELPLQPDGGATD